MIVFTYFEYFQKLQVNIWWNDQQWSRIGQGEAVWSEAEKADSFSSIEAMPGDGGKAESD